MTCHLQRHSIWETHQSISSAPRVRLPSFTAAISRHSAVLSPVSIQHDKQFATYQQRKPRISKLAATVAMTWPAWRWLWRVSNVPPSTVPRMRAVIYSCTKSASRTPGISSSQSANIFQLNSSSSTAFWRTGETPHNSPDKIIPAASGTAGNRCRRDCGVAPIARDVVRWMWCSWWDRRFVGRGRRRR